MGHSSLVLQAFSKAHPKQQSAIRYFFPLQQHNRWISMPNIILCDVLNYTTNGLCNRGTMHAAKTNYSATVNGDFVVKSLPIACIIVGSANVEYGQRIYSVLHGRKTQQCCYKLKKTLQTDNRLITTFLFLVPIHKRSRAPHIVLKIMGNGDKQGTVFP